MYTWFSYYDDKNKQKNPKTTTHFYLQMHYILKELPFNDDWHHQKHKQCRCDDWQGNMHNIWSPSVGMSWIIETISA